MNIQISRTQDGTISYPLHSHKNYEIMYYTEGTGFLKTKAKEYPFVPGTIIIVPPNIEHGSVSLSGFKNTCICYDFGWVFDFKFPMILKDNEISEGKTLVEIIFYNRFASHDYLDSLCKTYATFLNTIMDDSDVTNSAIKEIIRKISISANDSEFNVSTVLNFSGYSKDYIRTVFKKRTGKTPTEFLTSVRIDNACHLIELYKNSLSLSEIAERSGFLDYSYFSKLFKRHVGETPIKYREKYL
ncbi:MAG: AraC family transcriptional regulator [Ruminococcaceae bacterium]|nr:AraC family transcriptional regulator [Oscillospiraceae bacterium]